MITKKDASFLITEMKKVFVTKDDLKTELSKFVTKDDLKKELSAYATRNEMQRLFKDFADKIVKDVADMLQTSVINLLSEHEKRLDRLEKTAGGFPPITS